MNTNTANLGKPANSLQRNSLKRYGAFAYFAMPLCYIGMFVVFGLILTFPQTEAVSDKIAYIATQEFYVSLGYAIGYLVFGCFLLIAVQATHHQLKTQYSHFLNYASAFGYIWVVLMMCSGMLSLIGISSMVKLYGEGSVHAETVFYIYATVVNGLGGGIELVGAVWVLFLSIYCIKTSQFSKPLNILGVVVGVIGVATLYQGIPEFKDAFGLLQIIWFISMGFALLKAKANTQG